MTSRGGGCPNEISLHHYVSDATVGRSDGFPDQDKLPVLTVVGVDRCGIFFSWNGADGKRGFQFLKEIFNLFVHIAEEACSCPAQRQPNRRQ